MIAAGLVMALTGLVAGALIGAVGVGGVIVVPILTAVLGLDVRLAVGTSLFAFLIAAPVVIVMYARAGSIPWRGGLWLCLGVIPGAIPGALAVAAVDPRLLKTVIALLMVGTGLRAFARFTPGDRAPERLGAAWLFVIGVATGFISALTGTGGPVTLIPIFLFLKAALLPSIGLAQLAQAPVTAAASAANGVLGTILYLPATILAAGMALGMIGGAWLAHRLSGPSLLRGVSVLLVVSGLLMAGATWL